MRVTGRKLPDNRRLRGFTLIEILIAIAILGIGMAMIAAVFPTAMNTSATAARVNYGVLMCNSGIASVVYNQKLTQSDLLNTEFDDSTAHYRIYNYSPNTDYGCIVMGRMLPTDPDSVDSTTITTKNYQLIAVAFKSIDGTTPVVSKIPVTYKSSYNGLTNVYLTGNAPINSPLIFPNGSYAIIKEFDPQTKLAKCVGTVPKPTTGETYTHAYVITSGTSTGTGASISPAIHTTSTFTGLFIN